MSIRIMSKVWEFYPGGGAELLSLLALADWSDDEGRCYPSIAAIARKIRLKERHTQRLVHKLIDDGFVKVIGNNFGGSPGTTRKYQIIVHNLTGVSNDTPSRETGVIQDVEGCHMATFTGVTHDTQTIIEPSLTIKDSSQALRSPNEKKISKSYGATLKTFIEQCQTLGEKPIPENDPIFEYANKVGIDEEMLRVCWQEFKAAYLQEKKRKKDWRAHFRNAVRGNWYRLWYFKPGDSAQWTTVGEQARRAIP